MSIVVRHYINKNQNYIVQRRRNTVSDSSKSSNFINDKFWQEQVKRLIKETKNYKQLQMIKEKDTKDMYKEFCNFKEKYNDLKNKYENLGIFEKI